MLPLWKPTALGNIANRTMTFLLLLFLFTRSQETLAKTAETVSTRRLAVAA